jgi:hypothetical protein
MSLPCYRNPQKILHSSRETSSENHRKRIYFTEYVFHYASIDFKTIMAAYIFYKTAYYIPPIYKEKTKYPLIFLIENAGP